MADPEQDLNRSRNDESRLLELQGFGRLKQSRSNKTYNKTKEAKHIANPRDKKPVLGGYGTLTSILDKMPR